MQCVKTCYISKTDVENQIIWEKNVLSSLHIEQFITKISKIFNNPEIEQVRDLDSITSNAALYYSNLNIHA